MYKRQLKSLLPAPRRLNPPPQLTFLIAAVSKAIATTITYPVSLAKSRAQVSSPTSVTEEEGTEKTETPVLQSKPETRRQQVLQSAHKALRLLSAQYVIYLSLQKIYREEGLSGLYSGLEAEVLKGFLSHGLTMTVKSKMHVAVIQLYYMLLKLTRRWPSDLQKAQQGASAVVVDATERAGNVGTTVSEGTKQLVEEGKKVVGAE